ncbi:MAG TPA: hypothetical protein VLW54_15345 [Candidatus Acidoferrales bacterium]|nr:hypothetical protein [Candidatus Acidoferrales bacterium]
MGQQIETRAWVDGKAAKGTAMLETDYVLFRGQGKRGGAARVKIAFGDIRSLEARAGRLRIRHAGGALELELGARAENWLEKIRSPRGLLDKLGVAQGGTVWLAGEASAEFRAELEGRGCAIAEGTPGRGAALIFFGAEGRKDLARVKSLGGRLAPAGALWIVYPKGQKHITENDVIGAGRAAGLKDVKVARFSATHTALKFVIPVAER